MKTKLVFAGVVTAILIYFFGLEGACSVSCAIAAATFGVMLVAILRDWVGIRSMMTRGELVGFLAAITFIVAMAIFGCIYYGGFFGFAWFLGTFIALNILMWLGRKHEQKLEEA